jgi:hypothetical protein
LDRTGRQDGHRRRRCRVPAVASRYPAPGCQNACPRARQKGLPASAPTPGRRDPPAHFTGWLPQPHSVRSPGRRAGALPGATIFDPISHRGPRPAPSSGEAQ